MAIRTAGLAECAPLSNRRNPVECTSRQQRAQGCVSVMMLWDLYPHQAAVAANLGYSKNMTRMHILQPGASRNAARDTSISQSTSYAYMIVAKFTWSSSRLVPDGAHVGVENI